MYPCLAPLSNSTRRLLQLIHLRWACLRELQTVGRSTGTWDFGLRGGPWGTVGVNSGGVVVHLERSRSGSRSGRAQGSRPLGVCHFRSVHYSSYAQPSKFHVYTARSVLLSIGCFSASCYSPTRTIMFCTTRKSCNRYIAVGLDRKIGRVGQHRILEDHDACCSLPRIGWPSSESGNQIADWTLLLLTHAGIVHSLV